VRTIFTCLGIALLVVALGAALMLYNIYYSTPAIGPEAAEVRVEQGDTLGTVTRKLRERRVISNGWFFLLWARLSGVERRLHQGLYRFENGVTPREVLDRLVTGKGIFLAVTIPEGLTVKEIAALLEKMQIVDKETFLQEAANPTLLASFGLQTKSFEGYLFPSTYYFTPGTPAKDIIITMAEQFRKVSQPFLAQRDGVGNWSSHELLTLASIIEKETGVQEERALVSAVFHNRLRQQMPLQSDPTVIYGLKDFNGNLTRKDLQDANPYNTYRIAALPPGPICNPSISSIKAALHPADVPFLYFVSKNDGTHLFSETIEAHNRAVKTFQPVRQPAHGAAKVSARQ